jgi:hypothetical protein
VKANPLPAKDLQLGSPRNCPRIRPNYPGLMRLEQLRPRRRPGLFQSHTASVSPICGGFGRHSASPPPQTALSSRASAGIPSGPRPPFLQTQRQSAVVAIGDERLVLVSADQNRVNTLSFTYDAAGQMRTADDDFAGYGYLCTCQPAGADSLVGRGRRGAVWGVVLVASRGRRVVLGTLGRLWRKGGRSVLPGHDAVDLGQRLDARRDMAVHVAGQARWSPNRAF